MQTSTRLVLFCFLLLLNVRPLLADGGARFEQNKGQWPQQVRFRAEIPGGALFLEKQGLTYHFKKSNQEGRLK